jgi:hypothetical protein
MKLIQNKFFTTKYADVPRARIVVYSLIVASCFGIIGLITGEIKINLFSGCLALFFIQFLGKWCDFSRENSLVFQFVGAIFSIFCYILAILILFGLLASFPTI